MKKLKGNKGFTLMEMLIVVAIIAILIAIMIPTFTKQLERARETADIANIRSMYSEAMVGLISDSFKEGGYSTEKLTQTGDGWEYVTVPDYLKGLDSESGLADVAKGSVVKFTLDADGKPVADVVSGS